MHPAILYILYFWQILITCFRRKVLQFADIPVTCYVVDFSSICNMLDRASIEYYLIINAFLPQSFIYEKPDTHLRTLTLQVGAMLLTCSRIFVVRQQKKLFIIREQKGDEQLFIKFNNFGSKLLDFF